MLARGQMDRPRELPGVTSPFLIRALVSFCRGRHFPSAEPIVEAFPEVRAASVRDALKRAIEMGWIVGTVHRTRNPDGEVTAIRDIRGL